MNHDLCKNNSMGGLNRVNFNDNYSDEIISLIRYKKPFIIRNFTKSWPAKDIWTLKYLEEKVGSDLIHYVKTNKNNITSYKQIFQMKMSDFLVQINEIVDGKRINANIYLVVSKIMSHSRRSKPELPTLLKDLNIPYFIPFARLWEINLWVGYGGNRSNLHFDPEENLLNVIKGSKKFVLFSPDQYRFLYHNQEPGMNPLQSKVDIFDLNESKFPLMKFAKYYETEILEGETLYLPAGWWHAVESSNALNIAVNFWWLIEGYKLLNFNSYVVKQILAIKGNWFSVLFPKIIRH